jgi:hypothetical protein
MGVEFETQLRRIYERARSLDEVSHELRGLREAMESRRRDFEAAVKRTEDVIQRRFDSSVRAAFRKIQADLPQELEEFDRSVERVVVDYLQVAGVAHKIAQRGSSLELRFSSRDGLPESVRNLDGCIIGAAIEGSSLSSVHLGHPLVAAAVAHARAQVEARTFHVRIRATSAETEGLRGRRGRMRLVRATHRNFEITEQLVPVVVLDGEDAPLDVELARRLIAEPMEDVVAASASTVTAEALDDSLDELLFHATGQASRLEQPRFERTLEQIERFIGDRILLLERQRDAAVARLAKAQDARDNAIGAEQRNAAERQRMKAQTQIDESDDQIRSLRAGDDERYRTWRRHTEERRYHPPQIERLFDAEIEIS